MKATILSAIKKAQAGEISYETLHTAENTGKNEFLFFIKPELTLADPKIQTEKILDLVLSKIDSFGFKINNVSVLSASYLEKYNIIAQHYGVINKIASDAKNSLSESARAKFAEFFGLDFATANVMGGIEFLNQYPAMSPWALDVLWQNKDCKKLAGGTYCGDIKVDGDKVYVVNGFHPRQLAHFVEPGRSIVVFHLVGDLEWATARQNFIGATNPAAAEAGSLRNDLLLRREELGLAEVSQGVNGVHLSAGPVEGLIELARYLSNFSNPATTKKASDFSFGRALEAAFGTDKAAWLLENPNLTVDGKSISVFDITEEKSSDEALELLK